MSKIIKLGNYKGIEAKVEKHEVTNEEVELEVNRFVASQAKLVDKEGVVENGDTTLIDFEGFKDGVAFEGGKAEGFQLEIGSGQFIPGFEEQMIGMKKGETKELNLTFPEQYPAQDLAGADVVFKVTVHNIQTKEAQELTDEFVESLNAPTVHTVEEFKANIRESLEMHYEQEYMIQKENAILGKLIESSEVEVDDADIEKGIAQHIEHIAMELASQGMGLEQYMEMTGMTKEMLTEQVRPAAKQQAIFEAIIDEIVKVENLETTDEEVNEQVKLIASHNQVEEDLVLEKIKAEDLKRDLTRIKASQLVLNSAIITE